VAQFWRALPCKVDTEKKLVSAEITWTPRYLAFYALLVDTTPPKPPRFTALACGGHRVTETQKPVPIQRQAIALEGEAEPLSTIELAITGKDARQTRRLATVQAEWDGRFAFDQVVVPEGAWRLHATATDGAGNKSEPSTPIPVTFHRQHPTLVGSLSVVGLPKRSHGDRGVVGLAGQDADPTSVNPNPASI
jgi:hypothetical protein